MTRKILLPGNGPYVEGLSVPTGWGHGPSGWYARRDASAARRCEVIGTGDSTMFGATGTEGGYSWLQRMRERFTAAGYPDGGKGVATTDNLMTHYPADEVVNVVTHGFTGDHTGIDNIHGTYAASSVAGEQMVYQFRAEAVRLWYFSRQLCGEFTWATSDGQSGEVDAYVTGKTANRFLYLDGFDKSITTTLTITNQGGRAEGTSGATLAAVAIAPINNTGVVWHKHARNGATTVSMYAVGTAATTTRATDRHASLAYQTLLGLNTSADGYDDNNSPTWPQYGVDTSYPDGERVDPALAMFQLGFNDFTNQASADVSLYVEAIRKFGATCRAASCDGIVLSGQLPLNEEWPGYGELVQTAMRDAAVEQGLAFGDLYGALGRDPYTSGTGNPHLSIAEYQAQADWLADNLLLLAESPADAAATSEPTIGRWDGTALQPVTMGRWDGATLQQVKLVTG